MPGPLDDLLGNHDKVADVARTITGLAGGVTTVDEVDANPVPLTNMTTTALGRVRGTVGSNGHTRTWSVVVKILQSPDRSPIWEQIPPPMRPLVMSDLRWRSEPELYGSAFGDFLPTGMRLPRVFRIDDLDDAHVAIWMEDVAHRSGTWSDTDYGHAGRVLGQMWGRLREGTLPAGVVLEPRDLRGYFFGRIMHAVLPDLAADTTWQHPVLAAAADHSLRRDLQRLAEVAPAILDRLDALPRGAMHGDACPQNLLRSDDDTIVAIDWQFASLGSVAFDVAQVLAGHAESGDLDPDRLESVFEAALQGYALGLRKERVDLDADDVRAGAVGVLVIRSAFTAIPLEHLASADTGVEQLILDRCRYARFIVDLASTIL